MKAVWVTRSFLDYRVPVYRELSALLNNNLTLIYNADAVPERVRTKANAGLGSNAIALRGEWRVGPKTVTGHAANSVVRIPWQPGLINRIRSLKPNVLITDGFFQWTSAALWLRVREKTPLVVCYERTAHTERNSQWFRTLYRKCVLRCVDAICCSGRLCGEYAERLGMRAEQITYGHMVADLDGLRVQMKSITEEQTMNLRSKYKLAGTVFLYVGRLTKEKGIYELLRAWSQLEMHNPKANATLVLVGDGNERVPAEEFLRRQQLKKVRVLGAIDYDRLANFYAAANVFVIATLEDNWSLVVPEAMACGLPILCSKYNGCWPELVQEGRNGWVFDPLDPTEMLGALSRCVEFKHRLPAMGAESLAIVQGHTPAAAAEAVLAACGIAVQRCRRK